MIVIFPDKSYLYKDFLPDNYILQYRPGFNLYKTFFKDYLIDGYELLKNIDDVYYKTDTHINNKGSLIIYSNFIKKVKELFNLNISDLSYSYYKIEVESLNSLNKGLGDLTWPCNLGSQKLETINDTYYEIIGIEKVYLTNIFNENTNIRLLKYENNNLFDKTNEHNNELLDWNIIGKYIILHKNINVNNNYKVVIFYDSFLCNCLGLYGSLFRETYFVKDLFYNDIINLLNPDYVFEFRVERFLL